jgi:hypothetical protein
MHEFEIKTYTYSTTLIRVLQISRSQLTIVKKQKIYRGELKHSSKSHKKPQVKKKKCQHKLPRQKIISPSSRGHLPKRVFRYKNFSPLFVTKDKDGKTKAHYFPSLGGSTMRSSRRFCASWRGGWRGFEHLETSLSKSR